jgi:transcriptional regulator with XRE-family HTH domain
MQFVESFGTIWYPHVDQQERGDSMSAENTIPPGPPMVRIDGGKVRTLREALGLTQLYVATAVGVTTDTISRWENRRYPTIKKENALKLAEALEAPLSEILETEEPVEEEAAETTMEESVEGPAQPEPGRKDRSSKGAFLLIVGVIALLVMLAAGLWRLYSDRQAPEVGAFRLLPPHAAPGQQFPVAISVETDPPHPISLILKEALPPGCAPMRAEPPFTTVNGSNRDLKWIGQSGGAATCFAYLARIDPDVGIGKQLDFTGTVTVRKGRGMTIPISGPHILEVKYLHWADRNGDMTIDDEEILTVYDQLKGIESLDFDKSEIEAIWAGSGYRWDENRKTFVVY